MRPGSPGASVSESPSPPVLVTHQDAILRVRLNRPEKKNALDLASLQALVDALKRAESDEVRVVILEAAGDHFSGGGDIQVMQQFAGDAKAARERLRGGLNRVVQAMRALPKPVLGKIQGNAYGAGAGLAFQCDLSIASTAAMFSLSFRHVGLIPDTGLTWLLPRAVGLQKAKHLVWTASPFSAQDAKAWGLLYDVAEPGGLEDAVMKLAKALCDGPAATLGLAKRALQASYVGSLDEALEREAEMQGQAFTTAEHAEGRDAFFARRRPDFRRLKG